MYKSNVSAKLLVAAFSFALLACDAHPFPRSSTVSRITPVQQLTTVRREDKRPNTSVMSRTQLKQRLQKEITELEERREQSPTADRDATVASRLANRPLLLSQGTTVVGVPVSVFQVSPCDST
jgi:septal ring factor EnvC (AmiA/AmiB activator)